jgi:UDP-glucuronate 4-epimerase
MLSQKILVTGVAGFIGFHLASRLLKEGKQVVGIDNINDYYDVQLKQDRLALLKKSDQFLFKELDIADRAGLSSLFQEYSFQHVLHMAAQAGVRHSIENPHVYGQSNLVGFLNLLEECRHGKVAHLVFASSSSVYGDHGNAPFSESDFVDHPISFYAATKKSNELMAYSYAHLYGLRCTGLRFFTVYGPWGRPDMAYYIFAQSIKESKPIDIYNRGDMVRDFTYIDDVVDGVLALSMRASGSSSTPYEIFNIGNSQPVSLLDFIKLIENEMGQEAKKNFLPMQAGDVLTTNACINKISKAVNFRPKITTEQGVHRFVKWFNEYHG